MTSKSRQPDLQSLRSRALGARLICALFIVVAVAQAVRAGMVLNDELEYGYSTFLISLPGLAGPMLLIFALSLLVIAPWIHRAHTNLADAGVEELGHSPRWAVASFLVPGPNLYVPPQAMRELWNRSHGEEPVDARAEVGDVSSWWTCLLAGMGITLFLLMIVAIQRFTNLVIMTPVGTNTGLFLFALLLLAGSAWFLQRIVAAATRAQAELFAEVAKGTGSPRKLVVSGTPESSLPA